MIEERFQLLVEKYLEGRLADDEARELLEAPEPFRGRLFDEVTMAGLLARAEGPSSPELAGRVQAALRGQGEKQAMVGAVMQHLPAAPRRLRPGTALWIFAGLAAVVAIAFLTPIFQIVRPPERPVAVAPVVPSFKASPEAEAAIRRGLDFLRKSKLPGASHQTPLPADELVLLTFFSAGVGEEDPLVRKLLPQVLSAKLQRTYSVSLQAMALERLDRAKYKGRIAECAQFLVDNQCLNGQWSYGLPLAAPPGTEVKKRRDGPISGNNSCSAFAMLGLRACADAGVAIPPDTFERAARWWRDSRLTDATAPAGQERSGWCYMREENPHRPYGSMTAGGLASLVIADRLSGQDWKRDRAAQAGLNWVTFHFTAIEHYGPVEELMAKEMISDTPNPMTEFYYYLWAVERAAVLCGLEKLGDHDWYEEGMREILAGQRPDGSWYGGAKRCQPAWDTCFAILFLTRSTRTLGD